MRIAFIGGGAMGEAMIKCLLAKALVTPRDVVVSDISQPRRELLSREYGVSTGAENRKATEGCDIVILAVKPQHLAEVMDELKNPLPRQTVLSIVAGAALSSLCRGLNHSSVVRAMPNMPAQIGEGMIVWTATAEVTKKRRETAQSILGAMGKEVYVSDEKYLDMATALSGSGPAYVFLFIEGLIDAGVHIGLLRNIAEELVIQTVLGSTETVRKTTRHPAELRNMVTSPGGTTTEALLKLEKGRFRSLLLEAVAAAYEKARHL